MTKSDKKLILVFLTICFIGLLLSLWSLCSNRETDSAPELLDSVRDQQQLIGEELSNTSNTVGNLSERTDSIASRVDTTETSIRESYEDVGDLVGRAAYHQELVGRVQERLEASRELVEQGELLISTNRDIFEQIRRLVEEDQTKELEN